MSDSIITTATTTNNVLVPISPTSNDDESEYTDADEMSAPTELLAEFLSSIMQRDYKNALKYCKLSEYKFLDTPTGSHCDLMKTR
jgi:hypothetical protein